MQLTSLSATNDPLLNTLLFLDIISVRTCGSYVKISCRYCSYSRVYPQHQYYRLRRIIYGRFLRHVLTEHREEIRPVLYYSRESSSLKRFWLIEFYIFLILSAPHKFRVSKSRKVFRFRLKTLWNILATNTPVSYTDLMMYMRIVDTSPRRVLVQFYTGK